MKKRILSLILVAVMTLSVFAGCGNSSSNSSNSNNDPETNSSGGDEMSDPTRIVVTLLMAPGASETGVQGVQDAINEIAIPEINVEVELKTVSLFDPSSQYPLWINGNEDLDLICTAFSGIDAFVSQGMLEPMDELIADYAPCITSLLEEFPIANGSIYDGETYGIDVVSPYYGTRYGVLFRSDWLAEAGITVDEDKTYTMAELDEILAAVKEKYPDKYLLAFTGNDVNASLSLFGYTAVTDACGANLSSGVLMGTESTEIVNMFETQEYYDFIKIMSEWKEKGYTYPDAATTDSSAQDFIKNEISGGYLMRTTPEQVSSAETNLEGIDFVTINLTDYYYPTYTGNCVWSIPISCDEPEAAIKFLNLMYENIDVPTTLMNGIKGVDWEDTDTDGLIAYPDGVTADTVTYTNTLGLFGDRRYEKTYDSDVTREAYEKVTTNSMANPTASNGFIYDSTNYSNEIMNIETVMVQFMVQLECGIEASNLDTVYNNFISELKAAGIDKVIADKQAQLDAYLAE